MKKRTWFLMTFVTTCFLGINVQAGIINTLPPEADLATYGSLAHGGTFVADDNYLAKFTIDVGMSIPRTARPIIINVLT